MSQPLESCMCRMCLEPLAMIQDKPVAAQEPALGTEWSACMKLPVVVHVRNQRAGEQHVSTREGLTPILPSDLIMRGISGEEYPIGRDIFDKTYTFNTANAAPCARCSELEAAHKSDKEEGLECMNGWVRKCAELQAKITEQAAEIERLKLVIEEMNEDE